MSAKEIIASGKAILGIEFGSTRIKAVLTGPDHWVLAVGTHDWHDSLINNIWTYGAGQILQGLTSCYASLKADVLARYGVTLTKLAGLGISAMMHGYLAFDADMRLLVPFRTWRNTITGEAAAELTELMRFNIPQRWSIAHLHQAVLNKEEHLPRLRFLTTLAGYVHWLLTGEKVLGVGDAAGMFPIDSDACDYDAERLDLYDRHIADRGYPWKLRDILPRVLPAGAAAGTLTAEGAAVLDPDGDLLPGTPLCPPEGDAGTGMTATNSVAAATGNVSAGTSVFAMIVLDKPLKKVHEEIDMVTTPTGKPVAMVHVNTCTSDLNAWIGLLGETARLFGAEPGTGELYTKLFNKAMEGQADCGSVTAFNYYSGEPITGTNSGVPLVTRRPDQPLTLADFMRANIYSSLATLAIGMEILTRDEQVAVRSILGHGGLFKTRGVGQSILAAAFHTPVTVMETAGEGGAWGIALLAAYAVQHREGETLEEYLDSRVFSDMPQETLAPDPAVEQGFAEYLRRYRAVLAAEKAACAALNG